MFYGFMRKILSITLSVVTLISVLFSFGSTSYAEETKVCAIEAKYSSDAAFTLAVCQSKSIEINVLPEEAENKTVQWVSSDTSVAQVSSEGKVKGVGAGTAIITAISNDSPEVQLNCTVNVCTRKTGTTVSDKGLSIVNASSAKYSHARMIKDLKKMQETYPFLVRYKSLGKSYDNRDIYEITLGNVNAKKHILIQATMHAREYVNSLLVMRQVESICSNYYSATYKDKYYSEIFDKVCCHIIPMANPDGVEISLYGADGINDKKLKKSVKKICKKYANGRESYYTYWKANARGVDLNNNYPCKFKKTRGYRTSPAREGFKGREAASEIETKIMVNEINAVNPDVVLSYHSCGSVIYWKFGKMPEEKYDKQKSLYLMARKLTGYGDAEPNKNYSTLCSCFGDWVSYKKDIYTLTIETGVDGAPVKASEIKSIWKKNKYMLPQTALWALKNT